MTPSNLSGSLADFSVADTLALVAMGRRTARLQLVSGASQGSVHLIDGSVSAATADCTRAVLLRSVVAALPVAVDDLSRALRGDNPIRDLVDSGAVDRAAVEQVASQQCVEAVAEMLRWESGQFDVWVGSRDVADVGLRLEPGDLVASARTRVQQWTDLRAALPEPGSVLALVPEASSPPALDASHWMVLARVDGRRTLEEVLAATGAAALTAGRCLADLLDIGLVQVRTDGEEVDQQQLQRLIMDYEGGGSDPRFEPERAAASPVAGQPSGLEEASATIGFADPVAVADDPHAAAVESMAAMADPVRSREPEFAVAEPAVACADPVTPPPAVDPGAGSAAMTPVPADPVAELDEVGAEFAWSPWAQEMGLGDVAAIPVPDAPAEPLASQAYPVDTAALPVPQAPATHAWPGSHARTESASWDAVPLAASSVDEVATPPTPMAAAQPGESSVLGTADRAAAGADPLANGLLGQLMSSVRGL